MQFSDKSIKEFQDIFERKYGKKITREEAEESARSLVNFFDLLVKIDTRERQNKEKLKKLPKGFSFMDGKTYNCGICGTQIKDEQLWYDKWGAKCLACQKAIDEKIVLGEICGNENLWYSIWEFDFYFKLKAPTVRKLIRQNVLKARIIPDTGFRIFLIQENSDTLPPKELVESRVVQVGENTYSSQNWYEFKNPQEALKDYKILFHLTAFKQTSH